MLHSCAFCNTHGYFMKPLIRKLWLTLILFAACTTGSAQGSPPSASAANPLYEDSAAGLQQQFQDFLRIIRSGNQEAVQSFLDSFAIPASTSRVAAHFDPGCASQLGAEYTKAFEGLRSHIWWATGRPLERSGPAARALLRWNIHRGTFFFSAATSEAGALSPLAITLPRPP